nr:MAG TPA: hypothetical protein [Caudoviricetes sp.]
MMANDLYFRVCRAKRGLHWIFWFSARNFKPNAEKSIVKVF